MADESFGHCDAAFLGDSEGDAGHHTVGLGQAVVQHRAQALGARQPLAHGGDVGAALLGGRDSGFLLAAMHGTIWKMSQPAASEVTTISDATSSITKHATAAAVVPWSFIACRKIPEGD